MKNLLVEVTLWVPSTCPLGKNGQIIAASVSFTEAVFMNEHARQFGGHVQAFVEGREDDGYFTGSAEEPGLCWKPLAGRS